MFDKYRELVSKGVFPEISKQANTDIITMLHSQFDSDTGEVMGVKSESMEKPELLKHIQELTARLAAAKEVYEKAFGKEKIDA